MVAAIASPAPSKWVARPNTVDAIARPTSGRRARVAAAVLADRHADRVGGSCGVRTKCDASVKGYE